MLTIQIQIKKRNNIHQKQSISKKKIKKNYLNNTS